MGEAETFNFSIAILPEDIILFHSLYRTSIIGRKDLIKLAFGDNDKKAINNIPESYTSRVIEIFNTTLKVLGIRIDFVQDDEKVKILDNCDLKSHKLNDKVFVCTDYEFYLIETVDRMRSKILDRYPVMTKATLTKTLHQMIENNTYLSEGMSKDLYELVDSYNIEELEDVQASIGEEVNKMEGITSEDDNKEDVKPVKKTRKKKTENTSDETKEVKPKKKTVRKKAVTK